MVPYRPAAGTRPLDGKATAQQQQRGTNSSTAALWWQEKHPLRNELNTTQIVAGGIHYIHLRKGISPWLMGCWCCWRRSREARCVSPLAQCSEAPRSAPLRSAPSGAAREQRQPQFTLNSICPLKHTEIWLPGSSRGPPPLSGPAPFPHSHWRTPCLLLKVWW